MRNFIKSISAKRNPQREAILTKLAQKTENGTLKWGNPIHGLHRVSEETKPGNGDSLVIYEWYTYSGLDRVEVSASHAKSVFQTRLSPAGDRLWRAIRLQLNNPAKRKAMLEIIS